jgi:energy-coupling factor transporter ATP-binding protein EcfA2
MPLTLTFRTRQSRYWTAMADFYRAKDRFLHEMLRRDGEGRRFGEYIAADGSRVACRLTGTDLRQHALALGATGSGKSSLLEAMARALLSRASAFAVIDPHGDLADRVERWARISGQLRVVSLDFTRPESLPSWNPLLPMAGVDPGRQVDLLVSVLRRLYSAARASSWAWGVKVEEIVRMALRGSIESEVPVTLADLERFLLDPRYRKEALATAGAEATNYFLHRFGPQEQMYVSAVVNKLSPFLGSAAVRRFLGGGGEPVDLLDLPDRPVALIVNLARGALGAAADVLGRLLLNTLLLSALRRTGSVPETRRHFALLVDEAHTFAGTEGGLEDLLVTGRKFHFALTLASQGLSLFPAHLRPLLLGNTARQFYFRLPYAEARLLGPDILEPLGNVGREAVRPYDDLSDPLLDPREEITARMRELTDLPRGACYWALRGRRFKARRIRVDRPETPPPRLSEDSMARMAASEIHFTTSS